MREIKFRIWDKKFKKWLTSGDGGTHCSSNWAIDPFTGKIIDYVECDGEYTPSEEPDRYFDGRVSIKESPFVKQQYTGAKDRVGVEIYEGDIIFFPSVEGVYSYQKQKNAVVKHPFVCGNAHLGEVVGNIFENPELLKS